MYEMKLSEVQGLQLVGNNMNSNVIYKPTGESINSITDFSKLDEYLEFQLQGVFPLIDESEGVGIDWFFDISHYKNRLATVDIDISQTLIVTNGNAYISIGFRESFDVLLRRLNNRDGLNNGVHESVQYNIQSLGNMLSTLPDWSVSQSEYGLILEFDLADVKNKKCCLSPEELRDRLVDAYQSLLNEEVLSELVVDVIRL